MPDMIRVWPKSEAVKAHVDLFRHPDGQPLKSEGFEWPADSFTFRMIMDGDLTSEDPGQQAANLQVAPKSAAPKRIANSE